MTSPNLIIQLIQKDLKHHQLTGNLRKIKLDTHVYDLELMGIVAELMGIAEKQISNQWVETYLSFMKEASKYPVTFPGKELEPVAKKCYELLCSCIEIEKRSKNVRKES